MKRIRRLIVAMAASLALLLPALPAEALSVTFNPPTHNCGATKIAHLRFILTSGSSPAVALQYNVGVSGNLQSNPTSNWYTGWLGINVNPGQTYTRSTGQHKAHSTRYGGGTSYITIHAPTGQPAPTFSWIGWVCI